MNLEDVKKKMERCLQTVGEELKQKCEENSELIEKIVEKIEVDKKTYINQLIDECLYTVDECLYTVRVKALILAKNNGIEERVRNEVLKVFEKKLRRNTRLYL